MDAHSSPLEGYERFTSLMVLSMKNNIMLDQMLRNQLVLLEALIERDAQNIRKCIDDTISIITALQKTFTTSKNPATLPPYHGKNPDFNITHVFEALKSLGKASTEKKG